MLAFQVQTNRKNLADSGPVIKLEHGHRTIWIDFSESVAKLLSFSQVYLHQGYFDALFRQENSHSLWAGCCRAIVELHKLFLFIDSRLKPLLQILIRM
jgi:hypothetical protein